MTTLDAPTLAPVRTDLPGGPVHPALVGWATAALTGQHRASTVLAELAERLRTLSGADLLAVALTRTDPAEVHGWSRLGERAWLRQWPATPGPVSMGPSVHHADAEAALTLPWLSVLARERAVVAVPDVRALPAAAATDAAELLAAGAESYLAVGFRTGGVMFGSLALARAEAGPWPADVVAGLPVLAAALATRLEAEAGQGALADALARADAASARQQHFFATVGHELRTPIAAIVGAAELLADELAEAGHADWAADAGIALSAAEQLNNIITDLLTSARRAGQGDEAVPVSIDAAVADVLHWHAAPARSRGITLSAAPAELVAQSTPSALRQVLANLVGNAVNYTPAGGRVSVTSTRCQDRVRVAVADTGPGLDLGQQQCVFDPFVRFSGPGTPGTGLGLSLSRMLAERYGATLGVESTPGAGATFWLDMPAAELTPWRQTTLPV